MQQQYQDPQDPYAAQQQQNMGGYVDPMTGMVDHTAPVDRTDIGKIYEISRLYSRLVSINNVLKFLSNPNLDDLTYVNPPMSVPYMNNQSYMNSQYNMY
jgi:hypothetical protein